MAKSTIPKILIIFGTRPEALKLIPVINELKKNDNIDTRVIVTGQHQEMLHQVLKLFGIRPDKNLKIMTRNQPLPNLTAKLIEKLDHYYLEQKPQMIIVQGDTTSAFTAALTAYYHRIPVGHIEAGLRSHDKYSPFPEEFNRVIISRLAEMHFAPTSWAKSNLLKERVAESQIFITGNTIVDMVGLAKKMILSVPRTSGIPGIPRNIFLGDQDVILITGHRRESFGLGFKEICQGIRRLAREFSDKVFIYPVHLNPNVIRPVRKYLGNIPNILLIGPLGYLDFIRLMERSLLILTDSGGIQEEAPSLKKPLLIMREKTERPEALHFGTAKIVGTDATSIYVETRRLIRNNKLYKQMIKAGNPFGDGNAANRIAVICAKYLDSISN